MKYRAEGYALYWYCIELIAGGIDKNNITFELEHDAELIGYDLGIDQVKVEEIMRYMVEIDLFSFNESNRIVCLKLANRLDESTSKNPEIRRVINQARENGMLHSSNQGYVYLIQDNDLFKIGHTKNIHRRMLDIHTSNPKAVLLHSIESVDQTLLESCLHREFKEKRKIGEWFKLTPDDVANIKTITDGNLFVREGFRKVSGTELDKIRLDKIRKRKNSESPSFDSVQLYISENNLNVDCAVFHTHYKANNWNNSQGQEITNWKNVVRGWDKSRRATIKNNLNKIVENGGSIHG